MGPSTVEGLIRAGMADHNAGRLDAAAARYQQALALQPSEGNALHLLGLICHQAGRSADAIDLIGRATRARPDLPVFWFNFGTVLTSVGADDRAAHALATAVGLDPNYHDAYVNLANALQRLNRLPESADALLHAVRLRPDRVESQVQLGQTFWHLGQWGPAEAAFRAAVAARPDHVDARQHLAATLSALRRSTEAVAEFRHILETSPRALSPPHHSNMLLGMQYAGTPPAEVLAEATRWARLHAPPAPPPAVHPGGGRVRIGYVSADYYDHPVGRLVAPLFRGHDREAFEVFAYSGRATPDVVTDRLRASVEHWRDVHRLADDALADWVRHDRVDLLVDLAGHTAHHRLLAFARRPAAVQATYLGYPATTGVPAIDYRVTDAIADPPGVTDPFHTERLVRLPGCFLSFAPPADAPDVARPPATRAAHVTFGSFNAAAKIGPAAVDLWAGVLRAVPSSRLVLKSTGLLDAATRDGLLADLAAAGVDPGRVTVLPTDLDPRQHLARYAAVDVALDTFPYHGTMTTLDALWMGVPTVTLAGDAHVSRVGATILTGAGLPGFVAGSTDEYVAIAARWAADIAGLADLRLAMRDRVRASPLADTVGFADAFEAACRAMLGRAAHRNTARDGPSSP